jgi:hypothetical protein
VRGSVRVFGVEILVMDAELDEGVLHPDIRASWSQPAVCLPTDPDLMSIVRHFAPVSRVGAGIDVT